MADKAKLTGTGARALRMIVEGLLLDLMFDVPSDVGDIGEIIIERVYYGKRPPVIKKIFKLIC
jgi:ATP-dependent Clp protease ATP-binding subunit ClpX